MSAIIEVDQPDTAQNCPALGRAQVYTIQQGLTATLHVQMQDRRGLPINLTSYAGFDGVSEDAGDDDDGTGAILSKFREALVGCEPDIIDGEAGEVYDAEQGLVRVPVPTDITDEFGVYVVDVAAEDSAGNKVVMQRCVISVEASMFGTVEGDGPPTLMDVRMALRDFTSDNLEMANVEFSADEIITALLRPIREWNEMRPPLPAISSKIFPYREAWLKATVGYLLMTAGDWYRRVNAKASGGGLEYGRFNKEREYMTAGKIYVDEWRTWAQRTRTSLAMQQNFSSFG